MQLKAIKLSPFISATAGLLIVCANSVCLAQKTRIQLKRRPELVLQTGHSDAVWAVAFSPDGMTLASGSHDHTIKLWDVQSGQQLRSLEGHGAIVWSIAFSPDGKTLATGSDDNAIILWNIVDGTQWRTFHGPAWDINRSGARPAVSSVAFSSDGKLIAGGNADGTITIWKVTTGVKIAELKGHREGVNTIAFSPDGKLLASGGEDGEIRIWPLGRAQPPHILHGHRNIINSIAFSADGEYLVSGSYDMTIKLWQVNDGKFLRNITAKQLPAKGQERLLDVPLAVAFSPDRASIASGSTDGAIRLFDPTTGRLIRSLTKHTAGVHAVSFSANGKMLVSGGDDHAVILWDSSSGAVLREFRGQVEGASSIALSPDGRLLGDAGGSKIRLWDFATGVQLGSFEGHTEKVESIVFSPDGRTLASGALDRTVRLWDVVSGKALKVFEGPSEGVQALAFSHDNKLLASGAGDGTITLWDIRSGRASLTLRTNDSSAQALCFSPDNKILIAGFHERIRFWRLASGTELPPFGGAGDLNGFVTTLAISPNGQLLAAGTTVGELKIWNTATRTLLRSLPTRGRNIRSLAFSADGQVLACGSNTLIELWNVRTAARRLLRGHKNYVNSVIFSRDGKLVISGSDDSTVKVWDLATARELASLTSIDRSDWVVTTPDGLFDGSPAAWKQILWRFDNDTFNHAPVEAFFKEFYYPELLQEIMAGRRPKPAAKNLSEIDTRQPKVSISRVDTQVVTASAMAPSLPLTNTVSRRGSEIEVQVTDNIDQRSGAAQKSGSGGNDLRLFRNGSLVKLWRGDVFDKEESGCDQVPRTELREPRRAICVTSVTITNGDNKFTAYAFNHENVKSYDSEVLVNGSNSLKRPGTAYILAIGVNQYSNSQYDLKYAVADADDFADEVKEQQESLKNYTKVEVIPLLDANATKANITNKLAELAKKSQPEDAVIVYFAGHGTAQGNQFYLIPHDLGYTGARENLDEAGLITILDHSVSDRDLEKLFEGIDAGQLLLVIDACNSGQALEAEEKRRGPMNSKGLAQLAYEKGMYVMTAAQSYQAAQEAQKLGHGFLTYALVEAGLKQGAADREPKNGSIDIREWLNYATEEVPRMQLDNSVRALRTKGRLVVFVGDGREVGIPKNEVEATDNIQRPRIFYRRELEANPWVMAVTKVLTNP